MNRDGFNNGDGAPSLASSLAPSRKSAGFIRRRAARLVIPVTIEDEGGAADARAINFVSVQFRPRDEPRNRIR